MHDAGSARSLLEVEGVSKSFGDVPALQGIDLEVQRGEFFCLLGPSGCGKTTLLRIIAGLEQLDAGEIWMRGRALKRTPPEKRRLGMVFQDYALFPHLSVFDNVAFPLRAGAWFGRARRPSSLQAQVNEALRLVKLADYADRMPRELSGGQAQRVALARALIRRPDVVLLDEPLSALDLKVRQAMREELKMLQHSLETTFILVTHDQDEALTMATRIAIMNSGHVDQVGTPTELYRHPATAFVAQFIGEQSFVTAVCESRANGRLGVRWAAHTFYPLDRSSAKLGDAVTVMLRPEDVQPKRLELDANAVVQTTAFHGATVDMIVVVGGDALRTRCDAKEFESVRQGDRIGISIEGEAGIAFDRD